MELIGQESNSGDGPVINSAQAAAESLAIEIADIGESIQNLLRSEANDSTERVNAIRILSDDQERHSMELEINHMIHETNTAVERLDRQCKMLISNNKGMEEKIRKRSIDLERNNKRLESLTFQTVRPAFMDEYEQIEKELQVEYERYVVRFRNVDYLERELQSRRVLADERATAERSVKRMQRKYRQEELAVLEGGDGSDIDHEVHARNSDSRGKENSKPRENEATRPFKEGGDSMMNLSIQDISRIEASSTNTTPRSDDSPSDPSESSFDVTGSDMTVSISNSDDDF